MIKKSKAGFTLIELMLAMTFIAILLVVVTMTTIHMSKLYNKGLTLKTVNQMGRDSLDYIRRDVASSEMPSDSFVAPNAEGAGGVGRMCLSGAAYIWNDASKVNTNQAVTYADSKKPILFARLKKADSSLCDRSSPSPVNSIQSTDTTELLSSDTISVIVHELVVTKLVSDAPGKKGLYRINLTLGTSEDGTLHSASCKPADDNQANFDFCAINQFETVVYAGGKK